MSSPVPPAKPQKPPKTPPAPPRKAPSPVYDDEEPPPPSDDEDDYPPPPSDDEDEEIVARPVARSLPQAQSVGKAAPPPPPPPPPPPGQSRSPAPPARPSPVASPALSPTTELGRVISSKPPPPPSPSVSSIRLSVAPSRPPPPGPPGPPGAPPAPSSSSPSSSASSPKPTVSMRSPHESVSSVRSSSSSISPMRGFRPNSTASTMSTMTIQDPDEEILRMSGLYGVYENAILQNVLSKMNRDGKFEKNIFILTPTELMYFKMPAIKPNTMAATAVTSLKITSAETTPATMPPPPEPSRVIPLSTLLAMPLSDEDHPGKADKRVRTFKLLAKQKSFYLRAPSVPLKDEWMKAIQDCSSALQIQETGAVRDAAQTAPIYVSSENNCQICTKAFSFFVRKNHCHNCGKCVCEMCSRDKMRILKIDDKKLFRVCNPCGKELKSTRVYGIHRYNSEQEEATTADA